MTNRIPSWSTNLAINVPKDERSLLGRLSVKFGKRSVAALVKELIFLGLAQKCERSALELRVIRARYYAAALLMLFGVITWESWVSNDEDALRRARGQRVRVVRNSRSGREVELA